MLDDSINLMFRRANETREPVRNVVELVDKSTQTSYTINIKVELDKETKR